MNSWFTVKVKYTKQLDDGSFKRVSEPYLIAAMSFTDAESRIYEELGAFIRGEFTVTSIARTDFHDIFKYDDADVWYKCKIGFESEADSSLDGAKAKKVTQNFLISAHSVKDAFERLNESLGGMMIDFTIPTISVSTIVDIFPFTDELPEAGATKAIQDKEETKVVSEHNIGKKTVFSPAVDDEEEELLADNNSYDDDDADFSEEE